MASPDASSAARTGITVEECWTTVDGLRVRYLRAGSGPALILLHGLLGYAFSWRFNVSALAQHRTVYALDMPGAGFSERSSEIDSSFGGSALRLLSFAETLGLTAFDLLATSHGGAVAVIAAARAIEAGTPRVGKLILVAPVNPWSEHGRKLAPWLAKPVVSRILGWCMPRMSFATGAVVRRLYGDPRRISPGTVEGYSKPCTAGGSFDHVLKILKTWTVDLKELERALARVADVPTLLIWGSKDRAVFPESAQVLARHFRHCELVEFSGVGHLPYEEIPEQFNAAVVDFLTYIVCTNAFGAEGTRTILPLHGRAHLRNFAQLLDRLWLLGGSG